LIRIGNSNYFNGNVACGLIEIGDRNMLGPDVYHRQKSLLRGGFAAGEPPINRGNVEISNRSIKAILVHGGDRRGGDAFGQSAVVGGVPARQIGRFFRSTPTPNLV
jgi:hypothetical protein